MNQFEQLKKETNNLIDNGLRNNEKAVINYINAIFTKFGSNLKVRQNMSIQSFCNLLNNSKTAEEFIRIINMLDNSKEYEIDTTEEYEELIKDYEGMECIEKEEYERFLSTYKKLNDNLIALEY